MGLLVAPQAFCLQVDYRLTITWNYMKHLVQDHREDLQHSRELNKVFKVQASVQSRTWALFSLWEQKRVHISSLDPLSCSLWAQWKGHTPLLPRCLCLGLDVVNFLGCPSASTWLMPVGVWIWGLQALGLAGHNWVRRDIRTAMFYKRQLFVCVFVFICIWISLIFLNIQRA